MCGIAGFWGAPDAALLATMTGRIAHRGPDGEGFFEHPLASLGHRRLAIIDPAGGHQPVGTDDGLVQLTYNGEVYNFRELRAELEPLGHTFHTACDTEVVLHAYLEWGTDCFARFNGMWALAILDLRESNHATAARPRPRPLRHQAAVLRAVDARAGCCSRRRPRRCSPTPSSMTEPDRQWLYDYLLHGLHDHKPQTAFAGHPCAGRGDVGGRRRRRRARADLLDAHAVDRRPARSRRVPRPLRALGRTPPGRRRPRGHVPVGRDRLVVDRRKVSTGCSRSTSPTRCRSATTSRRSRSSTTAIPSTSASTWTRCSPRSTPSPRSRSRRPSGSSTRSTRWCGTRTSPSCRRARTRSGASCGSPSRRSPCCSTGRAATSSSPGTCRTSTSTCGSC